jgi:hypothetical protein
MADEKQKVSPAPKLPMEPDTVTPPPNHVLTACTKPVWANADHTAIDCIATFGGTIGVGRPEPFTASASDTEPHGQDLWTRLNKGAFGPIGAYVATPTPPATVKKAMSGSGPTRVG